MGRLPFLRMCRTACATLRHTVLAQNDFFPKAEVSRLRAASAASIVAAKGRSFRLTRSAFSLSPLATKASLPKGLSGRPLETFGAVLLILYF